MKTCCLICFTIICFATNAQNDSATLFSGRFLLFGLAGSNTFRIDARENSQTGNINFDNWESHALQAALGFGLFYAKNKALTFELNSAVNRFDYSTTINWSNNFGGSVGKMNLKNLYQNKFFVLVHQNFNYGYNYLRNYNKNGAPVAVPNPNRVSHFLSYVLSVGALYKHNNNFTFRLTLPLVMVGAAYRKDYTSIPSNYTTYTDYNYNTSFLYSIANLQLSLFWTPNFIQTKKNK